MSRDLPIFPVVLRPSHVTKQKLTTLYQGIFKRVRRKMTKAIDNTMKTIEKDIF